MSYGPQAHKVIGAVYDIVLAAPAIAAAITAKQLRPFYGPSISDRAARLELFIGSDGKQDTEADTTAALAWNEAVLGADIDETVTVPCAVWGKDGVAQNLRKLAEDAGAIAAAAAEAVRGAVNLGLDPVMWAIVPSYTIALMQTQSGAEVFIPFTVQTVNKI